MDLYQKHIPFHVISREDRLSFSQVEQIGLCKLASILNGNARYASIFMDSILTFLKNALAFKKEYKNKFIAAQIVGIVKNWMNSDLLTRMVLLFYQKHIHDYNETV